MTLILIGTGVGFDLTMKGLEELKKCDKVYIETYTNPIEQEKTGELEQIMGKKIEKLEREKVESRFLIDQSKEKTVCLLVSGDPLIATTHIILAIDAKLHSIPLKIVHNSSIYSVAPAKSGLQVYRFGKTATLVNPRPKYRPTSSLEIIRENISRNLHTLVLLDTEPAPMEATAALKMLSEFETAVVLSKLGMQEEKVSFGKISELQKYDLGKPPFAIIINAKLHPVEQEYVDLLKNE